MVNLIQAGIQLCFSSQDFLYVLSNHQLVEVDVKQGRIDVIDHVIRSNSKQPPALLRFGDLGKDELKLIRLQQ